MHTLIITLIIGTFQVQTASLEACQAAGHALIAHDTALHTPGASDSQFYCVSAEDGTVWSSVEVPL